MQLELADFTISVAQRVKVQKLLAENAPLLLTPAGRADLKWLLSPILAKTPAEQERFYTLYERYIGTLADEKLPEPEPKPLLQLSNQSKWWLMLIGFAVFTALSYSIYLNKRSQIDYEARFQFTGPREARAGDSLFYQNLSNPKDTNGVLFLWSLEHTSINNKYAIDTVNHHFTVSNYPDIEGNALVILQVLERASRKTLDIDTLHINSLCNNPPILAEGIQVTGPSTDLEAGMELQFSVRANPRRAFSYSWNFGDGNTAQGQSVKHTFKDNALFNISLTVRDTLSNNECSKTISAALDLRQKTQVATIALPPVRLQKDPTPGTYSFAWGIWALLLALLAASLFLWRKWLNRPKQTEEEASALQQALEQQFEITDKAPYEIPLQSKEENIRLQNEQFVIANVLRERQLGSRKQMDLGATLNSTIEQGGFPALKYRFNTRPTDYLFLIDEQNSASHQARLFLYLSALLRDQDVQIDLFTYNYDLKKLYSPYHREGINLDQLYRNYGDRRLIIFGDLHALVDQAEEGAVLQQSWKSAFRRWKSRIIVTPIPLVSWTYKEARLYQLFALFPSDISGLMQATQFIEAGKEDEDLPNTLSEWESSLQRSQIDVDTRGPWRDLKDYTHYFQKHPEVFRWFKALVVYPELNWNTTIAIGHALGSPVTFDNLMLLARIPALQEGHFEASLWREIWKRLSLEDEWTAREAVIEELEAIKAQTKDSFSNHKLEKELSLQQFALAPELDGNKETIKYLQQSRQLGRLRLEELDLVVKRQVDDYTEGQQPGDTLKHYLNTIEYTPAFYTASFWWALGLSLPALLGVILFCLYPFGIRPIQPDGLPYPLANYEIEEAVRLNNEAVRIYYDSTYSNPDWIPNERLPGKGVPEELSLNTKTKEVAELLIEANFISLARSPEKYKTSFSLPFHNLARLYYNEGIKDFQSLINNQEFGIPIKARFRRAYLGPFYNPAFSSTSTAHLFLQKDSVSWLSMHGMALSHHYLEERDSACMLLDSLRAKHSKNIMPSLIKPFRDECTNYNLNFNFKNRANRYIVNRLQRRLRTLGFNNNTTKNTSHNSGNIIRYANPEDSTMARQLVPVLMELLNEVHPYGFTDTIRVENSFGVLADAGTMDVYLDLETINEITISGKTTPPGVRIYSPYGSIVSDATDGAYTIIVEQNPQESTFDVPVFFAKTGFKARSEKIQIRRDQAAIVFSPSLEAVTVQPIPKDSCAVIVDLPYSLPMFENGDFLYFDYTSGEFDINSERYGNFDNIIELVPPNVELQMLGYYRDASGPQVIELPAFKVRYNGLEGWIFGKLYNQTTLGPCKREEEPPPPPTFVTDQDGNQYPFKLMEDGNYWITKNLKTTLPESTCYERKSSNCDKFGRLYPWEVAQKACAALGDGWHLPTDDEWQALAQAYGGYHYGTEDIGDPRQAFDNLTVDGSSGFEASPTASYDNLGRYTNAPYGYYWADNEYGPFQAYRYGFESRPKKQVSRATINKTEERACRCVKSTVENTNNSTEEGTKNTTVTLPPANPDSPEMVFVQGGTFRMGSEDEEADEDEQPVHEVTLSDYYIGKYEVTIGDFAKFVAATNYQTDAEKGDGSYIWKDGLRPEIDSVNWRHDTKGNRRPLDEFNHPVVHVSWNDAIAYCNWLSEQEGLEQVYTISGENISANWQANGYRLPTEAEWEYAARSRGKAYKYAWGNGPPYGNIADEAAKAENPGWTIWEGYNDGYTRTAPVGQFKQGDLELFDMTGNVLEWCWDWYDGDFYSNSPTTDPVGPEKGSYRVLRGGSWGNYPAYLRCSNRSDNSPDYRRNDYGFRLSRAGF